MRMVNDVPSGSLTSTGRVVACIACTFCGCMVSILYITETIRSMYFMVCSFNVLFGGNSVFVYVAVDVSGSLIALRVCYFSDDFR